MAGQHDDRHRRVRLFEYFQNLNTIYTPEPEVVEKLQTLAGIKEHDSEKGTEILMSAPGSEKFVELLKQNRPEIESNEAASIQLTGESDSHYYYKQSKDTKKSDNNKK